MSYYSDISELIGKTLSDIEVSNDEIKFTTTEGERYSMYHEQNCCESVSIEDINGDLQALIGHPILEAEERTSDDNPPEVKVDRWQDSFTWTFYVISNVKETVTIRWYGESNGYYSESVDFIKIK